jgi:tetratricopeptide (TPR) repeat protein
MDSEISQSEQWLRFVAWLEDNFRRVIGVAIVLIGVGTVTAFFLWQGTQKQRSASEELSLVLSQPEDPTSEALLAVAENHPGTEAGSRAMLLAAGALYTEGRFEESRSQFERLLADKPVSPLTPHARYGIAACREALGEIDGAIAEYKAIIANPASRNVIPQARFALGNLYALQGQPELAREQYLALASQRGTSLAAEAQGRLAELPSPPTDGSVGGPTLTPAQPTLETP